MRIHREARGYLLFGGLLLAMLEVLLVLAIIWWPSFEENLGALKRLFTPVPMLADQFDLIEMIGVPGYVVAQQFFKACNTLGAAAAVLFAMGAVAGEVQRGTLEIWLSRPVSRRRLYTERYLAGLAAVWIPVFLSSLSAPVLLRLVDETMAYRHLALCALHQSLFLGGLYSITFMFSALGSQPLKIAFLMLFFSIFEFAIYMVKTITDYSLFRLVDIEAYAEILSSDRLDLSVVLAMVAVNLVGYGVGLFAFCRRVP